MKTKSNNRIFFDISSSIEKRGLHIDSIDEGVVIDHIEAGKATAILNVLGIKDESSVVMANYLKSRRAEKKGVIKILGGDLTDRVVKIAASISPHATFNRIRDHSVQEKFKALVCDNQGCVTRNGSADIPLRFYVEDDLIRCYSCKCPHETEVKGKSRYRLGLKEARYLDQLAENLVEQLVTLRKDILLRREDYDLFVAGQKEFTEKEKAYLAQAEELTMTVNAFAISSILCRGYIQEKIAAGDLLQICRQRFSNCGLEGYSGLRLIHSTIKFIEKYFFKDPEAVRLELREDASIYKTQGILDYKKKLHQEDVFQHYLLANALNAVVNE